MHTELSAQIIHLKLYSLTFNCQPLYIKEDAYVRFTRISESLHILRRHFLYASICRIKQLTYIFKFESSGHFAGPTFSGPDFQMATHARVQNVVKCVTDQNKHHKSVRKCLIYPGNSHFLQFYFF